MKVLSGVFPRDYSYDEFWMVFDLHTDAGRPLVVPETREVELAVQIQNKVGKVRWEVPNSIRERAATVAADRTRH